MPAAVQVLLVTLGGAAVSAWLHARLDARMPAAGQLISIAAATLVIAGWVLFVIAFRRVRVDPEPALPVARIAATPGRSDPARRRLQVRTGRLVAGIVMLVFGAVGMGIVEVGVGLASLASH